ncbi:Uncharacterised protein [Mycobacterium tuberculosis]|nr:Uncharacterised protein [Mycobacterium tuberculosis]CKT77017.1 Uncharacterised protein [Mycobacterium tuberculosis]CKT93799.1 Uncharacterised protein [Mycobacterium tuberculosis]COX36436.1 Uncharacterised protein [Mycobacterium tuberculosis]COY51509.1 Uncharacterised protein [Mycobacterium tuberculosis]
MLAKARNAESILLRALAIDSMDTEQRQNRRKVAPRPSPSSLVSCCECRPNSPTATSPVRISIGT